MLLASTSSCGVRATSASCRKSVLRALNQTAAPQRRAATGLVAPAARGAHVCSAKGGVADAPVVNPTIEKGVDHQKKKCPPYKVMLHNDNYNRREYVVKVLLKVVDAITIDDAVVVMQEAHETGVALVIQCPQEDAERYCESLRLNGLTSTIEPGC